MKSRIFASLPPWIVVVPVILFIFAFGLQSVNRYTIRRDELTTLGHIGALHDNPEDITIAYTLESLSIYSADHAPLYYVLIKVWGEQFGFNYFVLRIVSVWFGMIAIAGTYWLGRRIASHYTGLFASLILGTNILFYGNVHEMRDWTMLIMLSVLVWIAYWHVAHKRQSVKWYEYIPLFILVAISLYTSYLVVFLLATIGLYHLLAVPINKRWWIVSVTVASAGLLFLPWLPVFVKGLGFAQHHIDNDNPMLLNNLTLIPNIMTLWGNGYVALFVILMGLGLYASWKDWKTARAIIFFFVLMLGSLLILNNFFLFLKRVRYVLNLTVPFALLGGYGLAWLMQSKVLRYLPAVFFVAWIFLGYGFTDSDEFKDHLAKDRVVQYPEYNSLIPILREYAKKRDLFIQAHYRFSAIQQSKQELISIDEYYMRDLKLKLVNFPLYVQWSDSGIDATPIEYATGLIPQYDAFWFDYHSDNITDEIIEFQSIVGENYSICETFEYGERSVLVRYVRTDQRAELCVQ